MISLYEIIDFLGTDVVNFFGDLDKVSVKYLRPIESVDEDTLDWISHRRQNKQQNAETTKAKTIVCDPSVLYSETIRLAGKVLIQVDNPRMALSLIANRFFVHHPEPGVHSTSVVHPEASLAPSVYVGPNCSIGKCTVGEGSRIYANVTIYDNVDIGPNAVIQSGAVIGTDGLGCDRRADGTLVKFPHLGGVEIGDDVEIGANCQIARGALSNTIIGNGCKINGLSFIAHNCNLGENVWITGNTMLAGSVTVEDNVTIYSKVIIREQRTIGKSAVIGMGAVVVSDVPPGETWLGNPAKRHER